MLRNIHAPSNSLLKGPCHPWFGPSQSDSNAGCVELDAILQRAPGTHDGPYQHGEKKAAHETAIHVFRFVLRKDIEDYCFSEAPVHDEVETAWPHLESRPDDVIMMTKLYMSSTSLSQPPMVFCPAVLLNKLNIKDLQLAPAAVLTDRQKKSWESQRHTLKDQPCPCTRLQNISGL